MPTSLFIFKNITCRGFWLNKYLLQRDIQFRMGIYKELLEFGRDGLLSEPVGMYI